MGIFTSFISFAQTIGKEVKIPEEKFAVVESTVDDKPAIIVVNTSLRKFKHKKLNWREHQTGLILLFYVSVFKQTCRFNPNRNLSASFSTDFGYKDTNFCRIGKNKLAGDGSE